MTRCGGRRGAAVICAVALVAAGCGGPKAFVRSEFMDHPPARVAVLPFAITYAYDLAEGQSIPTAHQLGRDLFRKTFYHAFTTFGYADVKLPAVDAALAQRWGPVADGTWQAASPQALGEALGVDALVYGTIQRIMHFATPLYTETSLEATLRMVDATTGDELWRQRVKAAERGGALVQKGQVVDFLKDQARSYNPGLKFLRVADLATRQAISGLPNPPMRAEAAEASSASGGAKAVHLAILPFKAKRASWLKGASSLRTYLAADLEDSSFDVIELRRVDDALNALGWTQGQDVPADLSLAALAKAVGADVILRATVTDYGRKYAVVESWVTAGLQVDLVDAPTGAVIWSEKKSHSHTSGLLKGPTGYSSLATAPIMGLKTGNLERVANNLAHALAADLTGSAAVKAYMDETAP